MKILSMIKALFISAVSTVVQTKNKFMASLLVLTASLMSTQAYAITDAACFDGDPLTACTVEALDASAGLTVIQAGYILIGVVGLAMMSVALFVRMTTKPKMAG